MKRFFQRLFRGFDDSDTWSLDISIVKYALPRLKRFRKVYKNSVPSSVIQNDGEPTEEEMDQAALVWDSMIEDMIYALEVFLETDGFFFPEEGIDEERYKRGWDYFHKHFHDLWW